MADPWTEFLRLFEVRPEEAGAAVAELAGGGAGTAVLDGVLQSIWAKDPDYWSGKFPYIGFPVFPDQLPPVDDWIVAGVPAVLALLGALAKNKDLLRAGVGGSVYGGGVLLHHTIVRNLPKVIPPSSPGSEQKKRYSVKTGTHRYLVTG